MLYKQAPWQVFQTQCNISRNVREGGAMFCLRLFWAFIFYLKSCWIGIKGISRMQLGSKVRYDGEEWFVNNMVGYDYIDLCTGARDASDGKRRVAKAPKGEVESIVALGELWHRFNFMRTWYSKNWLDIDVSRKLYPKRMRCSSPRI